MLLCGFFGVKTTTNLERQNIIKNIVVFAIKYRSFLDLTSPLTTIGRYNYSIFLFPCHRQNCANFVQIYCHHSRLYGKVQSQYDIRRDNLSESGDEYDLNVSMHTTALWYVKAPDLTPGLSASKSKNNMTATYDCRGTQMLLYHTRFDEISARQSHSPSEK